MSKKGYRFPKGHIPWNKNISCSEKTKNKISKSLQGKIGKEARNYKGGKRNNSQGYIIILKPNHPFCNSQGYVREHRFVIEKQIGRYLKPQETPHHLGEKDDNRPKMLMAFSSQSAHLRFHKDPDSVKPSEIIFDGRHLLLKFPK